MLALASVQSPAALQLQTLARTAASDAVWALTCRLADIKPLALGDDVVIGESNGRGSGIFAERDLLPGEILGRYSGKLLSEAQYQAAWAAGETSGDYAFELGDSEWLVDGEDAATSSWLRYVNHSVRRANCEAIPCNLFGETYAIYLQTMQPIARGDECFFDYGSGYWDRELGSSNKLTWQRFKIDNA